MEFWENFDENVMFTKLLYLNFLKIHTIFCSLYSVIHAFSFI